jgi:hypothetical protein
MLRFLFYLMIFIAEIGANQAFGLIGGVPNGELNAVVQLTGGGAICTGTLVGLNPVTVITARHCVAYRVNKLADTDPEKVIQDDFNAELFSVSSGKVPGDLAILIYPTALSTQLGVKEPDLFSVAPPNLKWQSAVSMCGFGGTTMLAGAAGYGERRCGQALLVKENQAFGFREIINAIEHGKVSVDVATSPENKLVKVIHGVLQEYLNAYGPGTRYGIGNFNSDAFVVKPETGLDKKAQFALINEGDSGGPWFVKDGAGTPHLFAVSSVALFSPAGAPQVIGSVSWRLDHAWSKTLLTKAVLQGADIRGYAELISATGGN